MAVCTNFVLINKILCGYGTMFPECKEFFCRKSKERFHTLESWATKPTLKLKVIKLLSKAYVKTAHAVYESTKLFRHGAISRYSR